MGTRRTPDDAYAFAKGAAIEHASGFMMQMRKPLDFLAVSDHGFYLGIARELGIRQPPAGRVGSWRAAHEPLRRLQRCCCSSSVLMHRSPVHCRAKSGRR